LRNLLILFAGAALLCVPAVSAAVDSSANTSTPAAKGERAEAKSAAISPAASCMSRHPELSGRAFGQCVSAAAKHNAASKGHPRHGEDQGERSKNDAAGSGESPGNGSTNPARTCSAMMAADSSGFQAAFGRRPNAFGKCAATEAKSKKNPARLGARG
jgi:hypothetical protein